MKSTYFIKKTWIPLPVIHSITSTTSYAMASEEEPLFSPSPFQESYQGYHQEGPEKDFSK